jgi:ribosome-associated translation inhibitor RaiA
MDAQATAYETYEISPRFRKTVEERIARLERDAATDELAMAELHHEDHIRRHRRMITLQRSEALRMRIFLDRARTREPRSLVEL